MSPREQAALSAVAEHQASLIQNRGDADEIEAFFAGWKIGNSFDRGVEPTLQQYDEWVAGQLAAQLPKLYVRCDQSGAHAEHQRDTEVDGQMVTIVCTGETREEDLKW